MSEFIDMKESERMIRALAGRVMRRLRAIPQSVMSFDDVEQELWIAWCKARDRFEPSRGIPWQAYVQRGMKQHINRVIEAQIERFEGQTFAVSLDSKASSFGDTEDGPTIGEIIASDAPLPSDEAEWESNYNKAISVMSDRAKIFVSLLREQPPELLNEVLVAQDKAEHAAKLGAPYNAPRRITSAMVFDLMGAPRTERTKITREVEQLGARLSK
ncbi:sigma factor [Phaeobacter gallaeciensis]|uniref:sigma factor n=1 Tax=Phaeobacter gallaeciensis TaxID=60890 RepID=UPI00238065B3|nr:sigma factor [Phaeobacter gallaeciensis]MDE4297054.1 sigma factor [Phaeobacter gallaeciensis]